MSKLDELLEKVGKREEVSEELLAAACNELRDGDVDVEMDALRTCAVALSNVKNERGRACIIQWLLAKFAPNARGC